jgi:hypothetical protein
MDYRIRCSGILCKPPCGAYLSRVGTERQGQGIKGRLYDYLMYGENKEVERK